MVGVVMESNIYRSPLRFLEESQVSDVICALHAMHHAYGTVATHPAEVLSRVGGLSSQAAESIEQLICELAEEGIRDPSVPRVMAELEARNLIRHSTAM
jgi:cation transport regulator ChaC